MGKEPSSETELLKRIAVLKEAGYDVSCLAREKRGLLWSISRPWVGLASSVLLLVVAAYGLFHVFSTFQQRQYSDIKALVDKGECFQAMDKYEEWRGKGIALGKYAAFEKWIIDRTYSQALVELSNKNFRGASELHDRLCGFMSERDGNNKIVVDLWEAIKSAESRELRNMMRETARQLEERRIETERKQDQELAANINEVRRDMVKIPEGYFRIKSAGYNGIYNMGRHEVTVAQYQKFISATGGPMPQQPKWSTDVHPVVNISWKRAGDYCEWLGGRLPTEMEWIKAARGGINAKWSFGNDYSVIGEYAWTGEGERAHPVGLKKPNPYGLYDVHGNVWEWVTDEASETTPVRKGGGWRGDPFDFSSVIRHGAPPDTGYDDGGFRCLFPDVSAKTQFQSAKQWEITETSRKSVGLPTISRMEDGDFSVQLPQAAEDFIAQNGTFSLATMDNRSTTVERKFLYIYYDIEPEIRAGRLQSPYVAIGDFNRDSFQDYVVVLKSEERINSSGHYLWWIVVFQGKESGVFEPIVVTKEQVSNLGGILYYQEENRVEFVVFDVAKGYFKWDGAEYKVEHLVGD